MPVVYKGKHHKNPAGCNNKAKWILSQTKWNKKEAIKLVECITSRMPKSKQRTSWYVALGIALAMHEEARLRDIATANVIDNYICSHINEMPHYILDYATSLRNYITSDITNQQKVR